MTAMSDMLSYNVPAMSTPAATAFAVGGATVAYYGYSRWQQAKTTLDKVKAGGMTLVGVCSAGLGALGLLSNAWQSIYPSTNTMAVDACRRLLHSGVPGTGFDDMPAMTPDHYSKLSDSSYSENTLYCHADATEAGKDYLNPFRRNDRYEYGKLEPGIRRHVSYQDAILGEVFAKVNVHFR